MRLLKTVLSVLLCLCIFAGCSSANDYTASEISLSIKELSPDTVSWASLDKSSISTYFGIPSDNILSFSGYINDAEEHFDMIAVFKFENSEVKEDILGGITSLTSQMIATYKLANQNEVSKISSPTIAETDNTIILCIMDKQEKILEYISDELHAEIIS